MYNTKNKHAFHEGYFFTVEPGFYRPGYYGVRLENVLEVIDTKEVHPTGNKFLRLQEVTLVPFEPKFIDRTVLSATEKRWLNDYNARIREHVGEELKKRNRMNAFYWMMNRHDTLLNTCLKQSTREAMPATQSSTIIWRSFCW